MTGQQQSSEQRNEPRIVLKPKVRGGEAVSSPSSNSGRNALLIGLGMVLLFLFGCVYLFQDDLRGLISNVPNTDATQNGVSDNERPATPATPQRERIIRNYMKAQDQRRLPEVVGHWSPSAERYYETYSPSPSELEDKISLAWDKVAYSSNHLRSIVAVGTSRVEVEVDFEFRLVGRSNPQRVTSVVVFKFDDRNRIVAEYPK